MNQTMSSSLERQEIRKRDLWVLIFKSWVVLKTYADGTILVAR